MTLVTQKENKIKYRPVCFHFDDGGLEQVLQVDEAVGEVGVAAEAVGRVVVVEAVLGEDGVVREARVHADFVAEYLGQGLVVELRILEDEGGQEGVAADQLRAHRDCLVLARVA